MMLPHDSHGHITQDIIIMKNMCVDTEKKKNTKLLILKSPFTTSMEERERCYSFVLSRTPHRPKKK
jgi:hypothetical protein